MKTLILYDSVYGNTEKIALAIGNALGSQEDVSIKNCRGEPVCSPSTQNDVIHQIRVRDVKPDQFAGLSLLIVGAPTQRFRTTPAMGDLLKMIPENSLKGVKVAAFDTRLSMDEINKTPILAFFVRLFGTNAYAAKTIANMLRKKGGKLVGAPEGFFVEGMEGPLVQGELERAASWARQLIAQ